MDIELFYEIDRTPGMGYINKVSGFRHSWMDNPKNKPIKNNVYRINKFDFMELVRVLDHTAIIGTPMDHDFNSGNLYLKTIGYASNNIYQGKFLESL